MRRFFANLGLLLSLSLGLNSALAEQHWFDEIKQTATDAELHQLLFEMPKGGDLHLHNSGSGFPEWWYELGVTGPENGYEYYTKVKINNCPPFGKPAFNGPAPYHLLFVTLQKSSWEMLSECEQAEFLPLADLNAEQKAGWLNAIKLDKAHEGRDEFFQTHWQRLGDMVANPHIQSEILVRNLQAFSAEGLIYTEPQVTAFFYKAPDGSMLTPDQAAAIIKARLEQDDAQDLDITWRFQQAIVRFLPSANQDLIDAYQFVARTEPWVAVNMVGREDNDKGYPLRFLDTLRELRKTQGHVRLSIHGGEVDEPNHHVRDTLLLGADRIGHGLNLITDPDTMLLMRHGPYLVEINLISNLLLEYVSDYSQHPFPEYLRTGIPVALSTDDRGMWDSTMTDEFFVAVKAFNLSWEEIKLLSRNSLQYAFVDDATKQALLSKFDKRMVKFEAKMARRGLKGLTSDGQEKRGFVCRRYQLCN
ncbi:MAG: adenosine deaminase [Pseudomonadales bacterium]